LNEKPGGSGGEIFVVMIWNLIEVPFRSGYFPGYKMGTYQLLKKSKKKKLV